MKELTTFFTSLHPVQYRNKYEITSHYFGLDYRIATGRDAFTSPLPPPIKQFIMEHGEVIVIPNWFKEQIVGILLRPVSTKTFRYYSDYTIPYGAGINDKPYDQPWVVVESSLDSDFLRQYYPYVIASFGVTVSNFLQDFLFNTSPYIIAGFDNDEAGEQVFKKLCYKYRGRVKKITPPFDNKDFGDTLNHLTTSNITQFELESLIIKTSLQILTGYTC